MQRDSIQIRPAGGAVGAEITSIDLSMPLADQALDTVKQTLASRGVVFFRDQCLTPEQHIRLARQFGAININRFFAHADGYPEIALVVKEPHQTKNIGGGWHTDHSYDQIPALGSMLYAREVPPFGGDTLFASMYAAYEALSPRMKAYLEGLTAVHDGDMIYKQYDPTRSYPINSHPIVRTHPVTKRKCLYINAQYVTKINELSKPESDAILGYLNQHCAHVGFQVRFRWRPHSVAFWDNRCTQHHALWDYFPQTRSGYRVTVDGDRPY
jgi:taurine dioxygenase